MSRSKLFSVIFSSVVLAACGGGGGGDAPAAEGTASSATTAPEATTSPTPAPAAPAASDTAAPTAEKLYGTWEQCEQDGSASSLTAYTFDKLSGTELSIGYRFDNYPTSDCSGQSTSYLSQSGVAELKGEKKTADGSNVVKLYRKAKRGFSASRATLSNGTWVVAGKPVDDPDKLVLTLSDSGLRVGNKGDVDADGFPTQLRPGVFKKK